MTRSTLVHQVSMLLTQFWLCWKVRERERGGGRLWRLLTAMEGEMP